MGRTVGYVGVGGIQATSHDRQWAVVGPRVRMCDSMKNGNELAKKRGKRPCFVPGHVGRIAQGEAIAYASGNISVVAEKCAQGVLDALLQTYPNEDHLSVFVVAGPGFNGLVGAFSAVLLHKNGYKPTVYCLERSLGAAQGASWASNVDVCSMLRERDIPLCDFAPRTLDFYFDVVVDGLLGVGFDGGDIRVQYWDIFELLVKTELPILSIDMPSGWDLDSGPRSVDVSANTFVQPEVLVSLGVAKDGAKMFAGAFHFLGGRHLPPGWADANDVELPAFRDDGTSAVLISSNAFGSNTNGEVYGRPGKFEATLWDNKTRRKWISDEEMDDLDLWDELD